MTHMHDRSMTAPENNLAARSETDMHDRSMTEYCSVNDRILHGKKTTRTICFFCPSFDRLPKHLVHFFRRATMPPKARDRAIANHVVALDDYVKFLRDFRGSSTWRELLGSCLVGDKRQVRPTDVVKLQPLFLVMLRGGLRNCMVTPSKLEAAFRICSDPDPNPGSTLEKDAQAHADHVRICFNFLRTLCHEDAEELSGTRSQRYPKTMCSARSAPLWIISSWRL